MPGAVEDGEHSPEDRAALEEDAESQEELQSRLETVMREKAEVESALEERSRRVTTLEASETASSACIRDLIGELKSKERANCDQIARYDTELAERESEVTALKTQLEAKKKRTGSREVKVLPSGVTSTAVERELVETPGHSDSKGVASPSTSRGVGGLI